jgi:hypothetical protein
MSHRLGEHTVENRPNWIAYIDEDSKEFIGVDDVDKATACGSSYQELLDSIAEIDQLNAQFKASRTKSREERIVELKRQLADLEQGDQVNYYGGLNC